MKKNAANGLETIVIGIVEDNKDDAKFFERLLKDCRQFKVGRFDYFQSGEACLEQMAFSNDIDVLLMDYNLGKGMMSGVECIRQLVASERTKHVKAIILTNEEYAPEQIVEALEAGAIGFLRKKSDKFALESAIRDAYYGRWTTYTSVLTDLIEYLKHKHRLSTRAVPNAVNLSALEREIIKNIAEGKSNEVISEAVKQKFGKYRDPQTNTLKPFSEDALKRTVLPNIYKSFGIDTEKDPQSRIKLAIKALRCGVVRIEELDI
ncbi:MAG: response regulator [Chlorobiales bacterium]